MLVRQHTFFTWTVCYLQRSLYHPRYLRHSHVSAGFASQSWHDSMIPQSQLKTARMKILLPLQSTFANGSYYVMCWLDHLLIVNYQNIFTKVHMNTLHYIYTNIASWIRKHAGSFYSTFNTYHVNYMW